MVSAALRKRCIHVGCLLWLGATLLHRPSCFGRAKQQPLSELRERSGLAIRKSARGRKLEDGIVLSRQEKILVSKIASASEKRNWPAARSFFAGYVGSAAPVYSAAMHAAFRSREYKDGAKIFEQCQANCEIIHPPVFTAGIRIFAKLGDTSRVDQIWNDALSACEFDDILGSARIAAAADAGNVTMAAETLDEMNRSNLSIQVHHINSAIRACWGEGKSQHKAAKYLFDLLPKFRLTPTIVSFTALIGAYHTASLQDVLLAYNEMKSLEIEPNSVFAETYMYSLLLPQCLVRGWVGCIFWGLCWQQFFLLYIWLFWLKTSRTPQASVHKTVLGTKRFMTAPPGANFCSGQHALVVVPVAGRGRSLGMDPATAGGCRAKTCRSRTRMQVTAKHAGTLDKAIRLCRLW